MPALTTVITHATGDVYPASDWNTYNRDNVNYLIAAGADLASAATIVTTNEFHGVTGVTTIDNLTPAAPVAGQRIRLWIKGGPLTIRNNGGGTGNIRTATGADRAVAANSIIEFAYDSTSSVWREAGYPNTTTLAYAEFTASVGINTTQGAPVTVVTAPAITLDGATTILVEFFAPDAEGPSSDNTMVADLYDGATDLAQLAQTAANNTHFGPMYGVRRLTPTAGSHTYSIRGWATGGAGLSAGIFAGPGTSSGVQVPGFIRIRREV